MKGTFIEKVLFLLKERGLTKTKFSNDLKLGVNQLRNWEKGEYEPTPRTVRMIADYFLVTEDSLTDPEKDLEYTYTHTEVNQDFSFLPLSEQERCILTLWRNLSVQGQMRAAQAIMNIADYEQGRA